MDDGTLKNCLVMEYKKMNPVLSQKIKTVSFFCILLVVWIHTYYVEGESLVSMRFLMHIIGIGVCLYAVPLFYAISGYLFFLGTNEGGFSKVFAKQKKRVRTLLVPFLLTNVLSICFYLGLKIVGGYVPAIAASLNFNLLDAGGTGLGERLLYYFWTGPIAYQTWFLRDLMIMVLFSPLIYFVVKVINKNWLLTIIGLCCSLFMAYQKEMQMVWSFGWFLLGGIFASNDRLNVVETKRWKSLALIGLTISLGAIIADALYSSGFIGFEVNVNLIIVTGVPSLWVLYDSIPQASVDRFNRKFNCVFSYTFFIFLIHEPFLNVVKKLPLMVSHSEVVLIVSYLVVPAIFFIIFIPIGKFLNNHCHKAYTIFVGGRA